MTVVFVTFGKSGERKEFTLEKKTTVIGRKTDADLRIPISEVSRAHCEITLGENNATLRDLGSSNGTFVNGERIDDDVVLAAGDRVRLGSVTFVVQINGKPSNITPALIAPPTAVQPVKSAPTKTAPPGAATEVGGTDDSAIDDLDIDDLDVDDLSDIDFTEEGSGDLDDLDELGADDLIEDDSDDDLKK